MQICVKQLPIYTILLSFVLLTSLKLNAQPTTGCGKNLTGIIHYNRNGFGTGAGNTSKFKYDVSPFSTLTTNTAVCPRFTVFSLRVPTTLCCINTDCGIDNFLYDFTNIQCPLDDYTPILFISIGALGLLVIRKRK